jgi:hypothetical protein
MAKKNFKIRARLVFSGEVTVRANSRKEAEELAERLIGATLGEVSVQTDEQAEAITDWDFRLKSETRINRKQEEGEE